MSFTPGNPMQQPEIPTGPLAPVVWDPDNHTYVVSANAVVSVDPVTGNVIITPGTPTSTVQILGSQVLFPDGNTLTPGIARASDPSTGLFFGGGSDPFSITFSSHGSDVWFSTRNGGDQFRLIGDAQFGWTSGDPTSATLDTILARDAPGILAQRNGIHPQQFNLYNTYTDPSNWERIEFGWDTVANTAIIQVDQSGTGGGHSLSLGTVSSGFIDLYTTNTSRWRILGAGHLIAVTDNAYDIGPSNARPRNIYVGGFIQGAGAIFTSAALSAGNNVVTSPYSIWGGSGVPAAGLGVNGDYYLRGDTPATSLQRIYVKSAGAWVGIV